MKKIAAKSIRELSLGLIKTCKDQFVLRVSSKFCLLLFFDFRIAFFAQFATSSVCILFKNSPNGVWSSCFEVGRGRANGH